VRPQLAELLELTDDQLDEMICTPAATGALDRRAFVATSLAALSLGLNGQTVSAGAATLGPDTGADMRDLSVALRRAYRIAPARQLYASAHEHLQLVLSLRPGDQTGADRDQLLIAAGEMAALCGCVLGLDLGNWSGLNAYLDLAERAAGQAESAELGAVVLAARAFHAAYGLGDKHLGLEFAEAATTLSRHPGVTATTRGWVAAVASERHADVGHEAASRRHLDQATASLDTSADDQAWSGIGSFDQAKLTAYEGGNHRRLGDFDRAVDILDRALTDLDPSMRRHRSTALIDRAEAHLGSGRHDAACADGQAAVELAAETQHAETLGRAEILARSSVGRGASDGRALLNAVLAVKATTTIGSQ
jgi:tetratricopeptide (TPR) repeat protein